MPPLSNPVRRLLLVLGALLGVLVLILGIGVFWLRAELRGSLPRLEGEVTVPGLGMPVAVDRDSLGVPTLRAEDRLDLCRALGWIHAQDRFFQMDLYRRSAAGELSALAGPALIGLDRAARPHRLRETALAAVARMPADERALLDAYVDGVNEGLAALARVPFEYLAFRNRPAPWRAEDSFLVLLAMFLDLEGGDRDIEAARGVLHEALPETAARFLDPPGTEWDAPLTGERLPDPPLPTAAELDFRTADRAALTTPIFPPRERAELGSNAFAVSGALAASGAALVANDMHLNLSVPNIWYRAHLEWKTEIDEPRRAGGVTLPGLPFLIAGSNGRVAWGLTFACVDRTDLVIVETDPGDSTRYRAPDGWRAMEYDPEILRVHGAAAETLRVASTIWGPVLDRDGAGRPRALRWIAHDPGSVNLAASRLMDAEDVDQAIALAHGTGSPGLNIVIADAAGRIAWTLSGTVPRRFGFDGRVPASWADGARGWDGTLPAEDIPVVREPGAGRIWSGNQRMVGGDALARIGDNGYAVGARAGQIRDALFALDRADAEDLYAVQIDDRALFQARWHRLLLATLDGADLRERLRLRELRDAVSEWSGHADVGSVAYRMTRAWRLAVKGLLWEPFAAMCRAHDPRFDFWTITYDEGPMWRLVTERPDHLLNPKYPSWDALLLAAADSMLAGIDEERPLGELTWGERNRLVMRHPLSLAVPQLARWLDMPPEPMPGDSRMPRVMSRGMGASERFVVAPGREDEGILQMPGGQSGHPLSPFFRAGHDDWRLGRPTPFLPGPAAHSLTLMPVL